MFWKNYFKYFFLSTLPSIWTSACTPETETHVSSDDMCMCVCVCYTVLLYAILSGRHNTHTLKSTKCRRRGGNDIYARRAPAHRQK